MSELTKHSPGPWDWSPFSPPSPPNYDTDPEPFAIYDANDEVVAYPDDNVKSKEEAEANACLMTAAPDLLAACEGIIAMAEGMKGKGSYSKFEEEYIARCSEAIAKAKGEPT